MQNFLKANLSLNLFMAFLASLLQAEMWYIEGRACICKALLKVPSLQSPSKTV